MTNYIISLIKKPHFETINLQTNPTMLNNKLSVVSVWIPE